MRLALISDIHGNLEAMTAVLQDIEKQSVDRIYCLGDVIGYGSDPVACLKMVVQSCDIRLMGNHEYVVLGLEPMEFYTYVAQTAAEWTRKQLSDYEFSLIGDFEMERIVDNLHLVHASPFKPDQWQYVLSPEEAAIAFEHLKGNICFHGHSHIPLVFSEVPDSQPRQKVGHSFTPSPENRYLINIGSVGQPRDNDPRACYVTFDSIEQEVTYHRVEYDIKKTQKKMVQAQLPEMLISRLSSGR